MNDGVWVVDAEHTRYGERGHFTAAHNDTGAGIAGQFVSEFGNCERISDNFTTLPCHDP
ncbi:MAG: hypothetical protein NWR64_07985 [Haliea sp.]|nr:hypothetical protein [Haliea sp.]